MVERYYNKKNELGVLISVGFGAGWSTWNDTELAYDVVQCSAFMNTMEQSPLKHPKPCV